MRNTIILVNGNIHTLEETCPRVEAMAICDGRIAALGTSGDVQRAVSGKTTVVDVKGRTVLPGFIDAHAHMLTCGLIELQADCSTRELRSMDDLVAFLKSYAIEHPAHSWIRSFGYDETRFSDGRNPNRHDLDHAVPDRPLIVTRICSHMAVLNSRAIDSLDLESELIPGIERDPGGMMNGIVHESAMQHVLDRLPPFNDSEIDQALDLAQEKFARLGICGVHDPGSDHLHPRQVVSGYQRALAQNRLFINTYLMLRPYPELSAAEWLAQVRGSRPDAEEKRSILRFGPVKLFADGSIGGRTAAMCEPYADRPDACGDLLEPEKLSRRIALCHREGFQICVHAIGDRAIGFVLDAFENAMKRWPRKDCRHRIEHCEVCSPESIGRMQAADIIPVIQPGFIRDFGTAYLAAVGRDRAARIVPQAQFLSAGLVVPEASDAPILAPDPLSGIQSAVTRKTAEGMPFFTGHAVGRLQAILGYTKHSAYASFQESVAGSLAVGKQGNSVVLDADPFTVPGEELASIPVNMTIVDGNVVFSTL